MKFQWNMQSLASLVFLWKQLASIQNTGELLNKEGIISYISDSSSDSKYIRPMPNWKIIYNSKSNGRLTDIEMSLPLRIAPRGQPQWDKSWQPLLYLVSTLKWMRWVSSSLNAKGTNWNQKFVSHARLFVYAIDCIQLQWRSSYWRQKTQLYLKNRWHIFARNSEEYIGNWKQLSFVISTTKL